MKHLYPITDSAPKSASTTPPSTTLLRRLRALYSLKVNIWQLTTLLLIILLVLPIATGLAYIFLPAFGYFPALGYTEFNLKPWYTVLNTPGLIKMLGLSLWTGMASTLISLVLALTFVSFAWQRPLWQRLTKSLPVMMAIPHVALAFGLTFLLIPSGLLGRIFAFLLGWQAPPDWQAVQDPFAFSLIGLLILKETPFLIFMLMAAISHLPVQGTLKVGQSLGYSPLMCWIKLLWPRLYPLIRMPVYAVLAFAIGVVDISLILGPVTPPLFAIELLNWQQDPDLATQLPAAAGSLLLAVIVILAIALLRLLETVLSRWGRSWLTAGRRGRENKIIPLLIRSAWISLSAITLSASLALLLWSFVWRWPFPSLWPNTLTLRSWQKAWPNLVEPLSNSLIIGFSATILALIVAVCLLELTESSGIRLQKWLERTLYLTMLLPQASFLFGIQRLFIQWQLDGLMLTVIATHLIFVLPYCYLSLSGPWRYYDQRYTLQAQLLSRSRLRAFWQVKIPILWQPLLASLALGFAVSIAQYLPTLYMGAGRITTVTTEAVSLISGGNRRLLGVYGLIQMLLPMLTYALALIWANWSLGKFRKRLNV